MQSTAEVINSRRLIEGEDIKFMAVRPVKHAWALDLIEVMKNNTWDEREVDLSADAKSYAIGELSDGNLNAYKKALAFLSNLDGIQLNNLTRNIGRYITSPEVSICIARQAWEEALHLMSYAQMIESIGFDPMEVYWMFEKDGMLHAKNQYILQSSNILGKDYSVRNFIKAVAANIVLEGIYFYNGFLTFYAIDKQGLMHGSAKMVKLIQRDETCHMHLFKNMWFALREENGNVFDDTLMEECYQLFDLGVKFESEWGKYIISEGVIGLTENVVEDFIKHLADQRLQMIGMNPLYNVKNSVPWFEQASKVNGSEENFFEAKVSSYAVGALEW